MYLLVTFALSKHHDFSWIFRVNANFGKNQEFSFRNYFTTLWLSSLSEDFLHANNFCTCTFRSTLMKWELTRNPSIYNMIRWADGTNNSSTKRLMFQVLLSFHKILQNSLQKPSQFIFLCNCKNENKDFWVP